jgi:cytochrome c peroxidase
MMMEERLRAIPEYVRRFTEVFGMDPTIGNAWRAIAAFERTLVSQNVPFDRYMQGEQGALSEEATRGLELFQGKAQCLQCHHGPLFTDESFHNLGVPMNPVFEQHPLYQITLRYEQKIKGVPEHVYRAADRDYGLYYITKREEDKGKFRTPPLREVDRTAPYMHNGVFFTLEEGIDLYDQGGGDDPNKSPLLTPLHLTDGEKKALLTFLESLSGDGIIVDPPTLPPYEALK